MENNIIKMTDAELEQFRAFQKEQQRKAEEERRRQMRTDYKDMVDREIEAAIPRLMDISDNIRTYPTTSGRPRRRSSRTSAPSST